MALFKKSNDPWDVDPRKARARREKETEKEPAPSLFGAIKEWNQERKAEAAEREAALAAEPPEKCPWCGKDMERGYLGTGRGITMWTPGRPSAKAALIGPSGGTRRRQLRVDHEGGFLTFIGFFTYKTAWYCQDCAKMVMDTADMPHPHDGTLDWPERPKDEEEAALWEEAETAGKDVDP